jgi:Lectin C-type domain
LNYWTDGIKKDSAWQWSVANLTVPSTLLWDVGQPDNKAGNEDCLHLRVYNGSDVKITDRNCSHKYIYACQVRFWLWKNRHLNKIFTSLQSKIDVPDNCKPPCPQTCSKTVSMPMFINSKFYIPIKYISELSL